MHRLILLSSVLSCAALAGAPVPQNQVTERSATKATTPAPKADGRPTLEVAFVLDTTGSMGGLLESAKQKIWSIASRMATGKPTPRIRVGLVAYRDRGDAYVTKHFDLTEDLDAVYANLKGFVADGGGDGPEHVGKGLADAVEKMTWTTQGKVARMIFLVGDAPSHRYGDGYDAAVWAKRAVERGIVVNTIRCGGDASAEKEFLALARMADGAYASIGQSGDVVVTRTPWDEKMAELNAKLASTSLYAGRAEARVARKAMADSVAAMPAPAAADRVAFGSRGGGFARLGAETGAVDLAAEPQRLAEMDDSALPDELRGKSAEAKAQAVKKASGERKAIEAELAGLSTKREAWLKDNAPKKKDSFDERVFQTVREKAATAGVAY